MSHFAEIKVSALTKNEKELVAALQAFFGAVEVYGEAKSLEGYDSRANKKAHIIVRKVDVGKKLSRGSAYNDLGFERNKDGTYSLHYDNMDISEDTRNKVMQDYSERVATKQLKAKGYSVKRELKDGVVKLTATKYS